MLFTKVDLFEAAQFGKPVKINYNNGTSVDGHLTGMNQESLTYQTDADGTAHSAPWDQIATIITEKEAEPDAREVESWYKTQKRKAANAGISLFRYYRSLYDRLLRYETDVLLKANLAAEKHRQIYPLSEQEEQSCLKALKPLARQEGLSSEEELAVELLLHLASKNYVVAIDHALCMAKADPTCLLPLACFYNDIGDGAATFYWLTVYFNQKEVLASVQEDHPIWWEYLKNAVAFDFFEDVVRQLKELFQIDTHKRIALKSLAYLFFTKNDFSMGSLLYAESEKPRSFLSAAAFETFFSALSNHLVDREYYSYYARYRRCLEELRDQYHSYTGDNDLVGYVYEFVPNRGYCRVVGRDLISYFLHFDDGSFEGSNNTRSIRQKLQKEMCSLSPVSDELLVAVQFTRSRGLETRRSYAITNAELFG